MYRSMHLKINTIIYIYIYICRVKELSNPGPLYTEPKAHVEEEEMSKDKQRKSKLSRDIAEDNPVLDQPRS